ncbi:MAG: hypothetical protein M3N24_11460 [Actinomycetota bacterium]|nr:hypothetical protein [Actinomycetota bacterium]
MTVKSTEGRRLPSENPPVVRDTAAERETIAEHLYARLSPAMAVLGVAFFLVVLGQRAVPPRTTTASVLLAAIWGMWAIFVLEFVLRMVIAPSTARFLRRHWWQVFLLLLPFLSFIRVVVILRAARSLRIVSAAVRSSRSANNKLRSRTLWLAAITAVVILAATDLLYEYARVRPYTSALHAAAMAAISGETIGREGGIAALLDVVLAVYSVVFFASLAGTIGAYFLEQRGDDAEARKGRDVRWSS